MPPPAASSFLLVLTAALAAAPAGRAAADGLEHDTPGARSIGRAGAVVVSEDSGAALLVNPGGLARSGDTRIRLGVAVHDDDTRFSAGGDSPTIEDRGGATIAPLVAAQTSVGGVVVAAAYLVSGEVSRRYPTPAFDQPAEQISRLYPHRHGGTELFYRRRVLAIGAAVRATSWLGLGVAATVAQVELRERRHIWAGFAGIHAPGDPRRELALTLGGRDRFVPGVTAGALLAPPALPLELALSIGASRPAALEGAAGLAATRTDDGVSIARDDSPVSRTQLAAPLTLRAGARYLGERLSVEAAGEVAVLDSDAARPWQLTGVAVIDDATGVRGELHEVPMLATRRSQAAARGAVEVELVRGFLWVQTGYAFHTGAAGRDRLTPAHAPLARHTAAVGLEAHRKGSTVTFGYARTLTSRADVDRSAVNLVNPFEAGTRPLPPGRYARSHDAVGLAVELAW